MNAPHSNWVKEDETIGVLKLELTRVQGCKSADLMERVEKH